MMKAAVLSLALLAGASAQTSTTPSQVITTGTTTPGYVTQPLPTTTIPTTTLPTGYPYTTAPVYTQPITTQPIYTQQPVYTQPIYTQQPVVYQPQPVVQTPTLPQPVKAPRLTGACNLYNTVDGKTTQGVVVYAVSLREQPWCLVLNAENCSMVDQMPTVMDSGATRDIYRQTQYYQCAQWRKVAANKFKATAAKCKLLSAASTDVFVKEDVAACVAGNFATAK